MRCELPILLRCCFCFPLRHGLLVWTYLKQIINLLYLAYMIIKISAQSQRRQSMDAESYAISSVIIILTIADILFNTLFIISAHKKDYRKIRIFYRYSIVLICLQVVMIGFILAMCIYYTYMAPMFMMFIWYIMLPSLVMMVLMIFLQGYLIILVRSEFIKLKNNSQFEFVNHAADQKCTANIDFVLEIPGTV